MTYSKKKYRSATAALLAIQCFLGTVSSSSAECPPDHRTHDVTLDFGGTCGDWQTDPDGRRIEMPCGDDMECVGWFVVDPEGQVGNHYAGCLPNSAVCDATDPLDPSGACPDSRLTCIVGPMSPMPGACFVLRTQHQDCPGPFQICEECFGGCPQSRSVSKASPAL